MKFVTVGRHEDDRSCNGGRGGAEIDRDGAGIAPAAQVRRLPGSDKRAIGEIGFAAASELEGTFFGADRGTRPKQGRDREHETQETGKTIHGMSPLVCDRMNRP